MSPKKNRVKIICLADTHLGFDYALTPRVQHRRRGDDFFRNYRQILHYAKENNADLIIHAGDVFFRKQVAARIVDMACDPLLECANAGIAVYLVPGNHERSELPVSLFLSHANINIFDKPRTFTCTCNGMSIALSGFPFQRGDIQNRFTDILQQTQYNRHNADLFLLCIHQAVEGATVGPSHYTFGHNKDTIKIANIPEQFDAAIAGHIHRHQILKRQNKYRATPLPIIFPGSIERTAFAEKNEDKGFVELECSTQGIEEITFHKLDARPMIDLYVQHNTDAELL